MYADISHFTANEYTIESVNKCDCVKFAETRHVADIIEVNDAPHVNYADNKTNKHLGALPTAETAELNETPYTTASGKMHLILHPFVTFATFAIFFVQFCTI